MNKKKLPKSIKLGYELLINRSGERGAKNWNRAGNLFSTSLQASEYKTKYYPDVVKYLIRAIRLNPQPTVDERFSK